jgi:hypothetical protein
LKLFHFDDGAVVRLLFGMMVIMLLQMLLQPLVLRLVLVVQLLEKNLINPSWN